MVDIIICSAVEYAYKGRKEHVNHPLDHFLHCITNGGQEKFTNNVLTNVERLMNDEVQKDAFTRSVDRQVTETKTVIFLGVDEAARLDSKNEGQFVRAVYKEQLNAHGKDEVLQRQKRERESRLDVTEYSS